MVNFIVAGILLLLVGAALFYVLKKRKTGIGCIGCPSAGQCLKKECNNVPCEPENENRMKTTNKNNE